MKTIIERILNEYVAAKKQTFAGHPMGSFFRNDIPNFIYKTGIVDSRTHLITGSVGQGNWATVPWICIFDRKVTTSATKGVYIVYLLAKDGKTLYLTFNQGCTDIRNSHSKSDTIKIMRQRAADIASKIDSRGFASDDRINLGFGLTELAELYQKGTIFYKAYRQSEVPSDEELRRDLQQMMDIYHEYSVGAKNEDWWPSQTEYPLNLTKEDWKKYILNVEMPNHPVPMRMLKAMMELDGEASCKKLSDLYGGHPSVYAGCAMNIGRRVKKHFNLPACMDGNQERYFPFPFLGKYRGGSEDNYIYRIRSELYAALKEIDLSEISPYYVEEHKTGKFDSWEIIDETTAVKTCDKSFFEYNGSGVPKEICWFFDAEDLSSGETKAIKVVYNEKEYAGKVANDTTDRRRVRIFWSTELGRLFDTYKNAESKATFVKKQTGVYEITIIGGENEMAVLDNVIAALKRIGGKGTYAEIYTSYETITRESLTDGKKAGIRGCIERNSSDSEVFSGNDVFYAVEGKGRGIWGLRTYKSKDKSITIKEQVAAIRKYIEAKGFNYDGSLIENFYLGLKSKPFVILAGTSGTGKTRLVKLFAEAIQAKYLPVPVRPDWSDSSDLFGHKDLNGNFIKGAIIDFVKDAIDDKTTPYILCLDEMNLARVEYYMSDILSVIETREFDENKKITSKPLVSKEYCRNSNGRNEYGELQFPGNLYIVGTVNMDETTFPFSKKVLDRANTIEFSYVDLLSLPSFSTATADEITVTNEFLVSKYITLNDCDAADREYIGSVCTTLSRINSILEIANAHIGYRVRDEIVFYMLNNREADLLDDKVAFDNQIMQKILPRVQGSSESIKTMLGELLKICESEKYEASAKKINFMIKRYEEDGFTSYWL